MANDEVLSMRTTTDHVGALKIVAERHGISVSDLIRAATDVVTRMPPADLTKLLACPTCKGTGQRFKAKETDG